MRTLRQSLREGTAALHHKMETLDAFQRLSEGALSTKDYRSLLASLWAFYSPLERRLAPLAPFRPKTPNLEQDLSFLGLSSRELRRHPPCRALPAPATYADAMGILYVLEGSTLGGQVLLRSIRPSLNLWTDDGVRFFNAYGPETGARWNAFVDELENPRLSPDRDRVVTFANETFCALYEWMNHADQAQSRERAI